LPIFRIKIISSKINRKRKTGNNEENKSLPTGNKRFFRKSEKMDYKIEIVNKNYHKIKKKEEKEDKMDLKKYLEQVIACKGTVKK
jgi:hypothetical protein